MQDRHSCLVQPRQYLSVLTGSGRVLLSIVVVQLSASNAQQCLPCRTWNAPGPGQNPMAHNGIRWPTKCIPKKRGRFFAIGDWGSLRNGQTMDNTRGGRKRPYIHSADRHAQFHVAGVMKRVARSSKPDYVLNAGDNFYPGGVETVCGARDMCTVLHTGQWRRLFEEPYDSPELRGKEWHGVLGNHDYGGWQFNMGWDQSIAYTWHSDRWLTPALYWERKVQYCDFSVDYYFVDTNQFDAFHPNSPKQDTNICSRDHNWGSNCGSIGGPRNAHECHQWFWAMWREQLRWLEDRLSKSTAEWQIVVTHFPPQWGAQTWRRLSDKYGIDLFITGHRHQQEFHLNDWHLNLGGTAWIVTGGGGGITSEGHPYHNSARQQQYGFVDLEITKDEITVDMWSSRNRKHSSNKVRRRFRPGERRSAPVQAPPPPSSWTGELPDSCAVIGCYKFSPKANCQCTKDCQKYKTCCPDFGMCSLSSLGGNNESRSSDELQSLSKPASEHQAKALPTNKSAPAVQSTCSSSRRRGWRAHTKHEEELPAAVRANLSHLMSIADLSAEQCFEQCGNKYGPCENFCGMGKACCLNGGAGQPPECQRAGGYLYEDGVLDECVLVDRHLRTAGSTMTAPEDADQQADFAQHNNNNSWFSTWFGR